MDIAQTYIDRGIVPDGYEVKEILDVIMTDARETLMYQRKRQSTGGRGG